MYCNHVAGEGSWGASVHTTLLMPGAYARSPLCERFEGMDWARGPSGVAFVYGDTNDWMDVRNYKRLGNSHIWCRLNSI